MLEVAALGGRIPTVGEIVLVLLPSAGLEGGRVLAHRVIGYRADGWVVTRGDNCHQPDLPHSPETLIGFVTVSEQSSRRIRLDNSVGRPVNLVLGCLSAWQFHLIEWQFQSHQPIVRLALTVARRSLRPLFRLARSSARWLLWLLAEAVGPALPRRSLELELLLAAVRSYLHPAAASRLNQLAASGPDWSSLGDLAYLHGLLPLLSFQLENICPQTLPPLVRARLQSSFQTNTFSNLVLTGELLRLVGLFEAGGIELLALKGPILAQQAYGDLALRRFDDLDLLVKPAQVLAARKLILAAGYRPKFGLTPAQQETYVRLGYEETFQQTQNGVALDLHWSLLPRRYSFAPTPLSVWAAPARVELGGRAVPTLPAHKLLLFLCLHGAKHNWTRLGWLADIAALLTSDPHLDWPDLLAEAGQFGTTRMLALGLYLTRHFFEIELPLPILPLLDADPALPALARQVEAALFENLTPPLPSSGLDGGWRVHYFERFRKWLRRDRIYLATMQHWPDQVRYWLDNLLVPTPLEWIGLPLPPSIAFLYYPIRPLRVAFKFLRRRY